MEIGLEDDRDLEQLAKVLVAIRTLEQSYGDFYNSDDPLMRENTLLADFVAKLPEPAVDPRRTLAASLRVAVQGLGEIADCMISGRPTRPIHLSGMLRASLVGAGKVVYMIGSDDSDACVENIKAVMRAENQSLDRYYKAAEKYDKLGGLKAPADIVSNQRRRMKLLGSGGKPGEATILKEAAEIFALRLAQENAEDTSDIQMEMVSQVFNTHSGVVHGFGWPGMVPGTKDSPGIFTVDLTYSTSFAQVAYECVVDKTSSI